MIKTLFPVAPSINVLKPFLTPLITKNERNILSTGVNPPQTQNIPSNI